jgi:cysteine-rich repeat protein
VVQPGEGEQCDAAGNATAMCDANCTTAYCGDGVLNSAAGEACDTAGDSQTCDIDCTPPSCGDGRVNTVAGEACDDGNMATGDGCNACQLEP